MADNLVVGEIWESLQRASNEEILKICRESSTAFKLEHIDLKEKDFRVVVYNVIWLVITGKASQDDVIPQISRILEQKPEATIILGDLLCAIDAETSTFDDKVHREKFIAFLSALSSIVPESFLKERIEPETLDSAGIIGNQKIFNQKLIRTKTKLFYKQQKFNLLREENEGYAKLITELGQEFTPQITAKNMIKSIKSLIGFFNLDPNRVMDIILELFECRIDNSEFFIELLTLYLSHCDISGLCHILGFKFQFYHDTSESKTPIELYKITALLLREKILQLDDIYLHLIPKDDVISETHKRKMVAVTDEARKLNVVSLVDAEGQEDKENINQKEDTQEIDNQKAGLCLALLEIGAWEEASGIMDRLPPFALLDEDSIAKSLCYVIHSTIDPLYRRYSPKAGLGRKYDEISGCKRCQQFTDLPSTVFPMLCHLGPHLYLDPVLLIKIIRLCKAFMKEYNQVSEILKGKYVPLWSGTVTLLDEALLPALSLMECNCAVAEEIWGLMKYFPYEIRYRLYGQWKNDSYNSHPLMIMAKAKTLKKAKYITKRLTKENVKPFGRQIGKASHSSPGILFEHILNQIQRYDNFIGPMVDALKYLTPLAYDVLAFCVIEALANPDRERMKQSDTNISDWLQSLASFCGTVFKKYAIELTGLLQYIANQLKAGKSLDLLVLKEVVQKMSGIELTEEVTVTQLEALCGGELLKAEGGYFGQVRNTKKSSQRLRDALIEGKLAIPLCLLIAQQRNGIVFVEDKSRHLKLVGKIYDQCQDTLVQFGGFLATQLNTDDYKASLPSLDELRRVYHISPDEAFCLSRSVYRHAIQNLIDSFKKQESQDRLKTTKQKQEAYEKQFCEISDDVYRPIIESAMPLHPPRIWNNISPQLYTVFWSLSMYELYIPTERYEAEIHKLKSAFNNIDDNKELTSMTKKKKEKERCQLLMDKLKEELQQQQEHNRCVRRWLESKKEGWFPSQTAKGETITQFLQICIFPRCVFTANDAVYCAKFIHIIHTLQTPNFSTLICFDRVFSDISYIVASLTENEASRYGRFLCSMLEMVMRWHQDKRCYEQECSNRPGFLTVLRATNNEKAVYLDYENFRHVCHKWQYKLTKAVVVCLESKDYMQIRNTITVLTKILQHYPRVQNLGQALERRVEKIIEEEKEKRQDLFILATGYLGLLKQRKPHMVPENKFHIKEEKEKTSQAAARSAAARTTQQTTEDGEKQKVLKKDKEDQDRSKEVSAEKNTTEKSKPEKSGKQEKEKSTKDSEAPKSRSEDEGKQQKSKKEPPSPSKHDRGRDSEPDKSEKGQRSKFVRVSKSHDESGNTEKSRSSSREKDKEKDKDAEREKGGEKERDKEKEKDREKEKAKDKETESEKDRSSKEKEKSTTEINKERNVRKSRPHSPLSDDAKKRRLDDHKFVSPSSKEGTPGSRSDDGKKDKKEKEKDKDKDRKNERKRTSLDSSAESKEAKRRKEDDTPERSSKKSEPTRKEKEKEKEKEGKGKTKDKTLDKEHEKSTKKEKASPEHNKRLSKEKDVKEDEPRSRKHRSSKNVSRDR